MSLSIRCAVLITVLCGCVNTREEPADEPEVQATVIEYGVIEWRRKFSANQPNFRMNERSYRIREDTTNIPGAVGTTFGVVLKLSSEDAYRLQVVEKWLHPPFESATPSQASEFNASSVNLTRNGRYVMVAVVFEEPWQVAPGEWTVTLTLVGADRKLVDEAEYLSNTPYNSTFFEMTFNVFE